MRLTSFEINLCPAVTANILGADGLRNIGGTGGGNLTRWIAGTAHIGLIRTVSDALIAEDGAGNLYGTTPFGGAYGWGTVFKLDSHGNYAVLYDFTNGLDGGYPGTDLVVDSGGNLYGTTLQGGDTECSLGYMGCGVLFKLDPAGNETVLHTFHGGDGAPQCTEACSEIPKLATSSVRQEAAAPMDGA